MSVINIAGFVVNGMVYVNKSRLGINLPEPYDPESGFTDFGWSLPNDSVDKLSSILISGKDEQRHQDITYNGTVLRPDGLFYDVKLAGPAYRLSFVRQTSPLMVFPTDSESAFAASYIEFLFHNPELDTHRREWDCERIISILSHFPGNHNFVSYMAFDKLLERVKATPRAEPAGFLRSEERKFQPSHL